MSSAFFTLFSPEGDDVILWSAAPRPRPRFALRPRPRGGRGSNGDSPREEGGEPLLRGTVANDDWVFIGRVRF